MASSLYLGSPGAGKTFGVNRYVIKPALEKKQRVVTNIPLVAAAWNDHLGFNTDGLIRLVTSDEINAPNFWFTAEGVGSTITQPGDCIVIDECHEFYGTDRKIKSDSEVFRAVRLQRKYTGGEGNFSTDIVFVTQSYNDITRSLREVCESMFYMQKLKQVGQLDTYRVDIFSDCRQSPTRARPINQKFGKYEPEYYALYNSYSTGVGGFAAETPGAESEGDERLNIWNSRMFFGLLTMKQAKYIGMGITTVAILVGLWLFSSLIFKSKEPPKVDIKPPASAVASAPSAPAALPTVSMPNQPNTAQLPVASSPAPIPPVVDDIKKDESSEYRLVGIYRFNGLPVAAIVDSAGKYRYLMDFDLIQSGPATYIKHKGKIIAPWTGPGEGLVKKMEKSL